MKISYPLRDTNGKEFRSLDEIMQLINGEAHGNWLLGANGLWHGGIHISDISNPFSALNPDAVNTGEPVPLQFMADGTIIAYRLNNTYLTAPYCGQQLRYSSSFVLVKSQCQPDPQKEKSWLEFYSLYMHLAPVSDYPASPCYKVRDGHSGILLRQYKSGQNGMPEGEPDKGEAGAYPAPVKTNKSLKAGDRFVSSRTGRFYVTKNGKAILTSFGLVRLLKENTPGDEQYWVTLDPELMEPEGEIQGLMPEWMQKAKQKGAFDSVELTGETEEWKVSAGTAVGFMGCMESPGEGNNLLDKEWFVHLEVLSTDPNMPGFLANPEGVKGNKRSVLVPKGKALFIRQDITGQPVFTATSARLSAQCLISQQSTLSVTDELQEGWYKITGSGWLPQRDVEEIDQYDLLKLGFQALEEDRGGDVMNSPYESWVPQAFGAISHSAEQGVSWQYGQVPPFYRDLMAEMDSNRDGKVTAEEIRQALAVRDPLVKNVVNRLVVKHHSEWCGGRSTGRWEEFYKDLDLLEVEYCEKWQADLEWMSQVPPFDKDEAVWHFHPVMFLDAIEHELDKQLIFPLTVKPENDPGQIWSHYDWRNMHQSNMAVYGTNRNGGARKHAARDLYTKPYEKVVAICDGKILSSNPFYDGTNEIAIIHKTRDGRKFIVRYGELDPPSIKVKTGDEVKQGQHIGNTGKLINPKTGKPTLKFGDIVVYMLHFELYTGKVSYNINPPLTDKTKPPFLRRSDLVDPIGILAEGYANTFDKSDSKEERLDITTLHTSENGKAYIKGWESLRLNAYNDSHGYCTIGYGHLIDKKRCENISLPTDYQGEITKTKADEMFDIDLVRFENGVKRNVNVDLYQHEFDALVSLLFNCGEFFFSSNGAPNLLRLINSENYESAAAELLDITNGGNPGLVKRRVSEKNLFENNVYGANN